MNQRLASVLTLALLAKESYAITLDVSVENEIDRCPCIEIIDEQNAKLVPNNDPYSDIFFSNKIGGKNLAYSQFYGYDCAAHDNLRQPFCAENENDYCQQQWCFVANDCQATDTTVSSLSDLVSYSYVNCGGTGVFPTNDEDAEDADDEAMVMTMPINLRESTPVAGTTWADYKATAFEDYYFLGNEFSVLDSKQQALVYALWTAQDRNNLEADVPDTSVTISWIPDAEKVEGEDEGEGEGEGEGEDEGEGEGEGEGEDEGEGEGEGEQADEAEDNSAGGNNVKIDISFNVDVKNADDTDADAEENA